jgi:hypothetical protein
MSRPSAFGIEPGMPVLTEGFQRIYAGSSSKVPQVWVQSSAVETGTVLPVDAPCTVEYLPNPFARKNGGTPLGGMGGYSGGVTQAALTLTRVPFSAHPVEDGVKELVISGKPTPRQLDAECKQPPPGPGVAFFQKPNSVPGPHVMVIGGPGTLTLTDQGDGKVLAVVSGSTIDKCVDAIPGRDLRVCWKKGA